MGWTWHGTCSRCHTTAPLGGPQGVGLCRRCQAHQAVDPVRPADVFLVAGVATGLGLLIWFLLSRTGG